MTRFETLERALYNVNFVIQSTSYTVASLLFHAHNMTDYIVYEAEIGWQEDAKRMFQGSTGKMMSI